MSSQSSDFSFITDSSSTSEEYEDEDLYLYSTPIRFSHENEKSPESAQNEGIQDSGSSTVTQMEIDQLSEKVKSIYHARLEHHRLHHPLSKYYDVTNWTPSVEPTYHGIQDLHASYTHEQSCRFLAYTEALAEGRSRTPLRSIRRVTVATVDTVAGHWAPYRIIDLLSGVYFGIACHQNLKEAEIIQIDEFSEILPAPEKGAKLRYSAKNALFIGDVIGVKVLGTTSGTPFYKSIFPCHMIAVKFYVLHRNIKTEQPFEHLPNYRAALSGGVARISRNSEGQNLGSVFFPVWLEPRQACQGYTGPIWRLNEATRIENALPTVFGVDQAPKTFSLEARTLLGLAARKFRLKPLRDISFVRGSPRFFNGHLSFDLKHTWNLTGGARILVGGVEAMITRIEDGAVHAKVLNDDGELPRKGFLLQNVDCLDGDLGLKEGFLADLDEGSNGKVVLERIFGVGLGLDQDRLGLGQDIPHSSSLDQTSQGQIDLNPEKLGSDQKRLDLPQESLGSDLKRLGQTRLDHPHAGQFILDQSRQNQPNLGSGQTRLDQASLDSPGGSLGTDLKRLGLTGLGQTSLDLNRLGLSNLGLGQPKLGSIPQPNPHQQYLNHMLTRTDPLIVASAPPGSNPTKCLTYTVTRLPQNSLHLIIAPSLSLDQISNGLLSLNVATFSGDFDFEESLIPILKRLVEKPKFDRFSHYSHLQFGLFLHQNSRLPGNLHPEVRFLMENNPQHRLEGLDYFFKIYMQIVKPTVVLTTVDWIQKVSGGLEDVGTVHFMVEGEVGEVDLVHLLASFPRAYFGIIGFGLSLSRLDFSQFPRICLPGYPLIHPEISRIFHGIYGTEVPKKTEIQNSLLKSHPEMFPNPNFPLLLIHNKSKTAKKEDRNRQESNILQDLVNSLLGGPEQPVLGIICLEKHRLAPLRDHLGRPGVQFGLLDTFPMEKFEILVVCCSNFKNFAFSMVKNSLEKMLLVGKQATVIIGNVDEMRITDGWKVLVERAELKEACVTYALQCLEGMEGPGNEEKADYGGEILGSEAQNDPKTTQEHQKSGSEGQNGPEQALGTSGSQKSGLTGQNGAGIEENCPKSGLMGQNRAPEDLNSPQQALGSFEPLKSGSVGQNALRNGENCPETDFGDLNLAPESQNGPKTTQEHLELCQSALLASLEPSVAKKSDWEDENLAPGAQNGPQQAPGLSGPQKSGSVDQNMLGNGENSDFEDENLGLGAQNSLSSGPEASESQKSSLPAFSMTQDLLNDSNYAPGPSGAQKTRNEDPYFLENTDSEDSGSDYDDVNCMDSLDDYQNAIEDI